MSRLLTKTILFACAALPAMGATYYVCPSGSDAHRGTRADSAWRTVAKVNAGCEGNAFTPGDRILFQRGGIWHEQLTCGNTATVLNGTPNFTGVTLGAYGVGRSPILDGANALGDIRWTRYPGDPKGNTWQASIGNGFFSADNVGVSAGQRILKLYVDDATANSTQLLPVSNYSGVFDAGKKYNFLDAVDGQHGGVYLSGSPNEQAYPPTDGASAKFWAGVEPDVTGIAHLTGSGIQNVTAGYIKPADTSQNHPDYPGVWWSDGAILYVNLNGADPNRHRFEGTVRQYGILLENAEKITVQDLTVERTYASGIEAIPIAENTGIYKSTESIVIQRNHIWNFGGVLTHEQISFAGQGQNDDLGGIEVRWDGMQNYAVTYKLPGVVVANNAVGTADLLFGAGTGNVAGIFVDGLDGGKVVGNFVKTQLAEGLDYNNSSQGYAAGNELTWNYGNFFHNSFCGQFTHNYIHEFWAEGVQVGGRVANSSACVQDISYNIVVNGYINSTGGLYNGIDCNGTALNAGLHIHHNSIINVWGAGITNESISGSTTTGCQSATVDDNIIDMPHPYFPAAKSLNDSTAYYFSGPANLPASLHNNLLILAGTRVRIAGGHFSVENNEQWLARYDVRSRLLTMEPTDLWVNYRDHDFRLNPDSPARAASESGGTVGAD